MSEANAPATDLTVAPAEPSPPAWRRWAWYGAGVLALALAGTAVWAWLAHRANGAAPTYVTQPVVRGDLTLSVTANGTLQPTRSIAIGSELSGTVLRVNVDVNDQVKKGQVLVELDTAKLRDQILRSRAGVLSAKAKVAQTVATVMETTANLSRLEEVARLSGGKVPSLAELDSGRATLARARADEAAARAAVNDAQAALSTDEINLSKASIRAPADGVVLTRSVDPGNAVAASLQAVTLFTIAEDLKKLRLLVNVDEADVGAVAVGQHATFTVSAYPNRKYPARVTRVAYGSTITDNVVTYLTDLDVDNKDLSLRPGMTVTATITATQHHAVLLVPNSALRYEPLSANDATPAAAGSLVSRLTPRMPARGARTPAVVTARSTTARRVWVLSDGIAVPVPVTPGISDGRVTEIVGGDLRAGQAVIVDQKVAAAK